MRRALMLLAATGVLCVPANADDPFTRRLDESTYLQELGRLQLTELMDYYLQTRGSGDPLAAARMQLAALGGAMQDPHVDGPARRELLDQRLAVRRERLAESDMPSNADESTWRLDQAEDHLINGLGFDRLGFVLLYGNPTPEQRTQIQTHVESATVMLTGGEIALEKAIWEHEQTPASRRSAAQRDELLRLRESERDRRLPFLRGMALVYAGVLADDDTTASRSFSEASSAFGDLHEQLDGSAAARTAWLHGLAKAHLAEYEDAEAMFQIAATHENALTSDVLAARLGGVINRSMSGGPDRGIRAAESLVRRYDQSGELADRIQLADLLVRLHLEAAETADRHRHEAMAVTTWLDLAEVLRQGSIEQSMADEFVQQKLLALPLDDPGSEHLPPELALAWIQQTGDRKIVDRLLARKDLDGLSRVRAQLFLSVMLEQEGKTSEAADLALEAASSGQAFAEGGLAVDRAAQLSLRLLLEDEANVAHRRRAVTALDRLLSEYPDRPGIDAWRLAAARLARQDGRLDAAHSIYASIVPGSQQRVLAARELAEVIRLQALESGSGWDDAIAVQRRLEIQPSGSTDSVITLVIATTLLDAGRSSDASDVLDSIDRASLESQYQAMFDSLTLRSAQGDASALVQAAGKVSSRSSADGGAALLTALQVAMDRIDAESALEGTTPPMATMERDILPLVRSLETWLNTQGEQDAVAWILVADGLRECGQPTEALVIYDRLLEAHPNAGSLLFGKAESLVLLEDPDGLAEAMGLYRRLTGSAGMESNPRRWWIGQLRMLEILDLMDRNSDRIAPRIRRLQQQDPTLGGADTKRAFERLLVKYQ